MGKYILQRILAALPVLFGILFITFALARLLPGDPCVAILGEKANEVTCSAFNARYGLDKPIVSQFVIYLKDVASGDLGMSFRFGQPVTKLIAERLPVTIELALSAMAIAVFFGVLLGSISATCHNSALDVGTMVGANLGVSVPVFVLGLFLAFIFAILLKDTPFALPPSGRLSAGMSVPSLAVLLNIPEGSPGYRVAGFLSNLYFFNAIVTLNGELFVDSFKHMLLPAIALATIPMALIARTDLLQPVGGPRPGLYPDGTRERFVRARGIVSSRNAQRDVAGGHYHWPVAGLSVERRCFDRDHLRLFRRRPGAVRLDPVA